MSWAKSKQAMRASRGFVASITKGGGDVVWICTEMGMAIAHDLPVVALVEEDALAGVGPLQGRDGLFKFESGGEETAMQEAVRVLTEHIKKPTGVVRQM